MKQIEKDANRTSLIMSLESLFDKYLLGSSLIGDSSDHYLYICNHPTGDCAGIARSEENICYPVIAKININQETSKKSAISSLLKQLDLVNR